MLGNLVSDSVDPGSAATKILLLQSENAASNLIGCLDDIDDAQTLAFAVGCLQNLCHDREWSTLLVERRVHTTLEALLVHPDQLVVRYASGALKNISVTLQQGSKLFSSDASQAVQQRSHEADLEEFKYRRAGAAIVRYAIQSPMSPIWDALNFSPISGMRAIALNRWQCNQQPITRRQVTATAKGEGTPKQPEQRYRQRHEYASGEAEHSWSVSRCRQAECSSRASSLAAEREWLPLASEWYTCKFLRIAPQAGRCRHTFAPGLRGVLLPLGLDGVLLCRFLHERKQADERQCWRVGSFPAIRML